MKFVDRVRIMVRAGDGGDGVVAWRREAHVPKGGPAGGDGGHGGSVYLEADEGVGTLLDLRYHQHHRAEAGHRGQTKGRHGRGGEDLTIRVPVGTVAYFEGLAGDDSEAPPWVEEEGLDAEGMENIYVVDDEDDLEAEDATLFEGDEASEEELPDDAYGYGQAAPGVRSQMPPGEMPVNRRARRPRHKRDEYDPAELELGDSIGDLTGHGDRLLVARGGRGGRGNIHFKSSRNRSPDRAEPGTPGDGLWLRLELKLLADVGIVGFPNVGKSTLIRKISRARPEVGAYPFTTLTPQLGVVSLDRERTMVVADVPGLVRGASEGRGLGHQFLRHLERTRVLLHLLAPDPAEGRSPLEDLDALEHELRAYGSMFDGRPRVVALNKVDTDEGQELIAETRQALRARNIPLFPISAATGEGVDRLLEALWRRLELVRSRGG